MAADPGTDQLNSAITDAFGALFGQMVQHFETVARRLSLPPFAVKALHMLESPLAMKELSQRFGCDPSFVTSIADALDSHGLGVREPDPRDRRIKHLRLTAKGLELREQVERELLGGMPWIKALDLSERQCLLGLLRKMTQVTADQPDLAPAAADHSGDRAGEVTAEPTPAASGGS